MKRCPECRKDYLDNSLLYCLDDGVALVQGTVADEPATAVLSGDPEWEEGLTKAIHGHSSETDSKPITVSLPAFLSRQLPPWIIAGALAIVTVLLALAYFKGSSNGETKAIRVAFVPPPDLAFNDAQPDATVISPDGLKIAFTATSKDGKQMLYIRNLDSAEVKVLPSSDNALEPF